MSGNDELTIIEPDSFFQILYQLYLPCGRQAVFRLIKKIQGAFFDLISKIPKSILTIGILLRVLSELFQYKFRPTVISRLLHLDKFIVIIKRFESVSDGFLFVLLILREQFFTPVIDSIIERSYIENIIENVIACDNTAFGRDIRITISFALLQICCIEVTSIKRCGSPDTELLGNNIQQSCFACSVSAVEYRNRLKFDRI